MSLPVGKPVDPASGGPSRKAARGEATSPRPRTGASDRQQEPRQVVVAGLRERARALREARHSARSGPQAWG